MSSMQFAILALLALLPFCHVAKADDNALKAAFWATGLSTSRATYESVLAEILLQRTQVDFGPFDFSVNYLDVNYDRGRRVVAKGQEVNFFTNPLPAKQMAFDRQLNVIPLPVMKGLLGYRVLIVRKTDVKKFKSIQSYSDLQNFRAGQVNYWADVPIYEENALPLVVGTTFDSLFFMLSRGRFDYIPLSAGEAKQTLKELGSEYNDLTIVPDIMIYYPFPVFFQVSDHYPKLSERLTIALELAITDGTLDRLFKSYFTDVLVELNSEKLRVFSLKNSLLAAPHSDTPPILVKAGTIIPSPEIIATR